VLLSMCAAIIGEVQAVVYSFWLRLALSLPAFYFNSTRQLEAYSLNIGSY